MSGEGGHGMHDPTRNRSCIAAEKDGDMHDQPQSLAVAGFLRQIDENDARDMHDKGSCKTPEFLGAAKAARLLDRVPSTITRQCESGKFEGATKTLVDGVEAWRIPIASLPIHAQRKMKAELDAERAAKLAAIGIVLPSPEEKQWQPAEYKVVWEAYERSGAVHKLRAEAAFKAVLTFTELVNDGLTKQDAERAVASSLGVSRASLHRYRAAVKGHHQMHWLPFLSPRYSREGRPHAPFSEEAWNYIHGKYLNTSETPLTVVLEAARALAPSRGWEIPSTDAVRARLAKEPKWLDTVGRKGPKALERSHPPVKRDYSGLALHELWESDGRKADVFCVWPDGSIARPFIIVWRDVRSRLVLGAKGYLTPTAAGVLAAFGQALERAGVAPDYAKIDNGREYAAKSVTGGQATRYRFKVIPGEPLGIMTQVGTKAEWSRPGRGQDKPIESFWTFVATRCDKAPEFAGAYCGRNPVAKPEDFDRRKAIPIAVYAAKLAAVLEFFNNDHRHRGSGMGGRTPMEVYTELCDSQTRRAVDPAHVRLCKMGVASIKPNASDNVYALTIPGYGTCRYWSKEIAGLTRESLSRKHAVYYDLENPSRPVSVYDGKNWLGDAALLDEIQFRDEAGERAGAHVKAKNAAMKPQKAALTVVKAGAQLEIPELPEVTQLTELPSIHAVTIEGKRQPMKENRPVPPDHAATAKEEERIEQLLQKRKADMQIRDPRKYAMLYGTE
jgi:putative transposase